jgi:hypothetical protein
MFGVPPVGVNVTETETRRLFTRRRTLLATAEGLILTVTELAPATVTVRVPYVNVLARFSASTPRTPAGTGAIALTLITPGSSVWIGSSIVPVASTLAAE